jgi:hypothetical protein
VVIISNLLKAPAHVTQVADAIDRSHAQKVINQAAGMAHLVGQQRLFNCAKQIAAAIPH